MSNSSIALVTGANRGIGREIARQLAARGAKVILTARALDAAQATARAIPGAEAAELEATDADSIARLATELARRHTRLDVLVNNAGINIDGENTATTVDAATLRATFETNTVAPLLLTQAVMPLLQQSPAARIVNISSSMAATGNTMVGYPAYRVAKSALNAITIQLAAELQDAGIAVNAACPGWVRTDLGGPHAPRSVEQGADTPVWLALDAPQSLTGQFVSDRSVIPW